MKSQVHSEQVAIDELIPIEIPETNEDKYIKAIDKLLSDNTEMAQALLEYEKLIEQYDLKIESLQYHLKSQRDINGIVKDCLFKFSNESTLNGLINVCANYIAFYYKPSKITFYMSDDTISNVVEGVDDNSYSHMYEFPMVEDYLTTSPEILLAIFTSMGKMHQNIRNLSSFDLSEFKDKRTIEAVMCKIQYSNKIIGFILLEFESRNDTMDFSLLSSLIEIFSNSYSVLAITHMLAIRVTNAMEQAYLDVKTGIGNSRQFNLDLENMVDSPYCIISMDIDNFKLVNDNYGHDKGDEALSFVAQCFNRHLENIGGKGYREGGDEFLGLTTATLEDTEKAVDSAMAEIRNHVFHDVVGVPFQITNSAGIYCNDKFEHVEIAKKKVDILLYMSKEKGKKQYTIDQDVVIK